MEGHTDNLATGRAKPKLRIVGRPRPGAGEEWIVLEEPGEPVLVHWHPTRGHHPHWRLNCPNCEGAAAPVPLAYMGAIGRGGDLGILELSWSCFCNLEAAARIQLDQEKRPGLAELELTGALSKVQSAMLRRVPAAKLIALQRAVEECRVKVEEAQRLGGAAPRQQEPRCTGLRVVISRRDFRSSPRVLRCVGRAAVVPAWPYHTRTELCRIWDVRTK